MNLHELKSRAARLGAQLTLATKIRAKEEAALATASRKVLAVQGAQEVFQSVAAAVQQQAHDQIAGVVSKCLSAVFDTPYEFKIRFEKRRGKTEADLAFVRNGKEVDPLEGAGGGVVDVAAFALLLASLALKKPARRRVLILDEPFRFVSAKKGYRDRVRTLLEELAEEMDIQFIMVTHDQQMQAGKVIEID